MRDERMPRTVYWDRFCAALRGNTRYVEDNALADVLFPAEDLAMETNWPRYGDQSSAFLRGAINMQAWTEYLQRFVQIPKRLCLVNMQPFVRAPQILKDMTHITVADGCLTSWERSLNPRTISMLAMPITIGASHDRDRPLLASFRGVMSHPCREALRQADNGGTIVCQFVDRGNHAGLIDAEKKTFDETYGRLMEQSAFAFVPRGDAHFSYRLAEAMSFGCIPVVLSDGWVLPFDRVITWTEVSVHAPESQAGELGGWLERFSPERRAALRRATERLWISRLSSLEKIVDTLLDDMEQAEG
jgi:hypothetical protein